MIWGDSMSAKDKIYKKLPFLLGFLICNNIFYLFKYNHLYINISNFISLIIFVYILFYNKKSVGVVLAKIDKSFYLYILSCLFSIVPAVFYFIDNIDFLMSYFNGIPSLILLFIEYYCILYFSNEKAEILNGIKVGSIVNVLVSFVSYVCFLNGSYFTLFPLFPNSSFQICGNYAILNSIPAFNDAFKIYLYRAQGMFLETSHYLTFVAGSFVLVASSMKKNINKLFYIILTLYLCLLSFSGNFVIMLITVILYFTILIFKNKSLKVKKSFVILLPAILIFMFGSILYVSSNEVLLEKINNTFLSLDFNSSDNENRTRTIVEGIKLIEKYPLGIGYNNTSRILRENFPSERQSYIFSTLILNELELGLIGNIIYIYFIIKFPLYLIKNGRNKEDYAIATSMIGVSICQLTNGISYWNIQYILIIYAIGNVYFNEIKNNKQKTKKYIESVVKK